MQPPCCSNCKHYVDEENKALSCVNLVVLQLQRPFISGVSLCDVCDLSSTLPSSLRLGGPDMSTKAKSELFSALFKLHHLANCMYHRIEENEAKRSSLLPFGGDQI